MANNILSSVGRLSAFAYHGGSRGVHSSAPEGLPHESDMPLDAFDQELLAECPPQPVESVEHSQTRLSLPPRTSNAHIQRNGPAETLRNDLYSTPFRHAQSSSSTTDVASSPTVLALQARQSFRSSRSSDIRLANSGGAGRFTDHAGGTAAPEIARLPKSTHGVNKVYQQGQTRFNPKPHGSVARLGLGHAPPVVQGIPLIQSTELPDRYRSIFPYPVFNAVQSKCFSIAFDSKDNLVVSAPTGSGKTAIMELAICQMMAANKAGDFKVVYQAPTKSLCSERMRDWSGKFASLDVSCAELTGDTEHTQLKNVQSASIIITTPEKWDSVTRKWKDNEKLMKMVKLFLIDEVHILKETRGATLEAVVSRMKSVGSDVRFVALSATVPNSDDIAVWLGKTPDAQYLPAHRAVFGEEYRPVKLEKHVWGIRGPANDFAFDRVLDDSLRQALAKHSKRKPTMVFCTTRKMAADTAKMLTDLFLASASSSRLWPVPKKSYHIMDADLSNTVRAGVAFHHGGVDAADRRAVEEGFLASDISIICCTSTLAVGVNLPCYLVVIKGTVTWTGKGTQEYSDLEIMQMLGRAGRPQFEASACAVILTRPEKEIHYKKMVSGEETLESCLHLNLIDHLNSEVGLGTVSDINSAKKWLASTFMFVRLQKNPRHYQLEGQIERDGEDHLLESICERDISLLQQTQLVTAGTRLKCTEFGDAMARYYVKFDTMKTILTMTPEAKISEIISILAQASEFSEVRFKSGEKSLYKELNSDVGIKFPIKVDIAQNPHKISLLIQSELGGSGFPNHDKWKKHRPQFNIDKNTVFSHVNRLIRCIIDCQLQMEDAVSVRHSLELARSLAARVWDNSPFQMKQIDAIGDAGVRKLVQAGINSIETLQNTEPHRIESALGRHPPFGQKVLAKAMDFPSLHVSVKEMGKDRHPGHWVKINFKAEVGFVNEKIPIFFRKKSLYVCFLAETSDGRLIDFRRFAAKKFENGQDILLSVQLTKPTTSINCCVMCDEVAGTSRHAELKLEPFPASYFPAQSPTVPKLGQPARIMRAVSNTLPDCEDYGGLDDADLLAALDGEEGIEVIHDIDKIVLDSRNGPQKSAKRSADKISSGNVSDVAPYREPSKLANGNWTCQHDCKERGKACKHVCCVEGVKNPAKPGRKKAMKKDNPKEEEADELHFKPSTKTSPFEKARLQAEVKKQKSNVSENQQTQKAERLHASSEEKSGPKPSLMRDVHNSPVISIELADAYTDGAGSTRAASRDRPPVQREEHRDTSDGNVFDMDTDDEGELFAVEASAHSRATKRKLPDVSSYTSGEHVHAVKELAHSFAPVITYEKQPFESLSSQTKLSTFGNPSYEGDCVESRLPVPKIDRTDDRLDNEADLGGFHAPLAHRVPSATPTYVPGSSTVSTLLFPAPSEKGKGLFITANSSSPEKCLPMSHEEVEESEDYWGLADEKIFATLEAAESGISDPPAKRQKVKHEAQPKVSSVGTMSDLQSSRTRRTSSSLAEPEVPRQPPASSHGSNLQAPTVTQASGMSISAEHETWQRTYAEEEQEKLDKAKQTKLTEEKHKKLAEEEQRKKWEGYEDLYELFGDCVEIV